MEEPIKAPACAAPTYAERTARLEHYAAMLPCLAPAHGFGRILEIGDQVVEPDLSGPVEGARDRAVVAVLHAITAIAREDGR